MNNSHTETVRIKESVSFTTTCTVCWGLLDSFKFCKTCFFFLLLISSSISFICNPIKIPPDTVIRPYLSLKKDNKITELRENNHGIKERFLFNIFLSKTTFLTTLNKLMPKSTLLIRSKAFSGQIQVNPCSQLCFQSLTIFVKSSILDVWEGFVYTPAAYACIQF